MRNRALRFDARATDSSAPPTQAELPPIGVPLATVAASAGSSTTELSYRNGSVAKPPLLNPRFGLIAMAWLLALMAPSRVASVAGHHGGGGLLPALVLGGAVFYVGYSAWRAVTLFRLPRRDLLGCLEAASMAASFALMAGTLAC